MGNSLVSSAIWEKHSRVSFRKASEGRVQFERLLKTYECMFYEIVLETIILLANDIQGNMTRIHLHPDFFLNNLI